MEEPLNLPPGFTAFNPIFGMLDLGAQVIDVSITLELISIL
jgi:hypothetical protein